MDRASLRNFFLSNGIDSDGGAGSDRFSSATFGNNLGNGNAQPSYQSEATGYPFLLQEYLRQQQQQQQQQQQHTLSENTPFQQPNTTAHYDNSITYHAIPVSNLSRTSFSNFENTPGSYGLQEARNATWVMGAGPPSVSGTQTSSTSDLSTSDRIMLERLQATSNASFMVGNSSAASAPSATERDVYAEQGILGPWSERSAGLLGSMFCTESTNPPGKIKRTRRKQPKDKPKRPLSAYNIFFKEERARLLDASPSASSRDNEKGSQKRTANGKIGFENLAKIIGGKWQDLQPAEVEYYKSKASADMERYKKEMEQYNKKQTREQASEDDSDNVEDEEGSSENGPSKRHKRNNEDAAN